MVLRRCGPGVEDPPDAAPPRLLHGARRDPIALRTLSARRGARVFIDGLAPFLQLAHPRAADRSQGCPDEERRMSRERDAFEDGFQWDRGEEPIPGLLLTFGSGRESTRDVPGLALERDRIRPTDVAWILTTLEEIYAVSVMRNMPPAGFEREPEWVAHVDMFSGGVRLGAIRKQSDLHVLLELPAIVYAGGFVGICFGIANVLGAPLRAAARFQRAREEFWNSRLSADQSKLDYYEWKRGEATKRQRLPLKTVDVTDQLPPLPPPAPDG